MQRTNIYLDEDQLQLLKHVAAEEGKSVSDLVRGAVDRLLVERTQDDETWPQRFDELIARVRSRMPENVTEGEIEADIALARREVREARRARRR